MKKFLPLTASIFLVGGPTGLLTQNLNSVLQQMPQIGREWLAPTSMANLVQDANNIAIRDYDAPIDLGTKPGDLEGSVEHNYRVFYGIPGVEGITSTLSTTVMSEELVETFVNTYKNNTPNKQTFKTQEYSKTVTNISTFSLLLRESISVKLGISFWFMDTSISGSIASDQVWTDTVQVSETNTVPSQDFVVDPYSIGKVHYNVFEGRYKAQGIIRFFMPDIENMTFFPTQWGEGHGYISFSELVKKLNAQGYGNLLKMNSGTFSIISADNPSNPSRVSLNLPIEWESKGSRLDVEYEQIPISR